jgi:hypothetical protein
LPGIISPPDRHDGESVGVVWQRWRPPSFCGSGGRCAGPPSRAHSSSRRARPHWHRAARGQVPRSPIFASRCGRTCEGDGQAPRARRALFAGRSSGANVVAALRVAE